MRSRRLALPLIVLAQIGIGAAAAKSEGVSVSRYRLQAVATSINQTVREQVDAAVLEDFCKDDDGCAVLLVSADAFVRFVKEARLILSPTPAGVWTTTDQPEEVFFDGNGTSETVVTYGGCTFSDVDDDGADDTAVFSLTAQYNIVSITCILTLID